MMFAYLGLLLVSAVVFATAGADDIAQSAYLDVEERFYIEWKYTDTNITILARVNTTGWFGIGFSPNGGMAGADIITAGFANGKPYLQDRYAEKNGFPAVDQSQDVELLSGSEENGVTSIKFTRKHNTCDDKDLPIGTDTMRVIYAISPDGKEGLSYHTPFGRGTRSIYLRRKISVKPNIPADSITFDITVNNIDIPAYHTRYYCEVKRAPKLDVKHHIIKVEPLIQKANLGIVHHIIIYGCFDGKDRDHYFEKNNTGFDCYNGNMPQDLDICRAPVVIWAIGGGTVDYPDEAGYPIGDSKSPDYYMMEVHYDNPKLISGKKDNSGIRLTLTQSLRQHDAAILATGAVFGITVPPNVKDFSHTAFCTNTCTQKSLKDDVSVFGAYLHGHLATHQVSARQFRNGKELRVIDEDRNYDFNYQQYKMLEKPIDLKAGDDIMVTCHYNTEGRTGMTFGGLPSQSEMCIAFLSYYPAQDVSECYTRPGWAGRWSDTQRFIRNNLNIPTIRGYNFGSAFSNIKSSDWTEERVKKLEAGYLNFPQINDCTNRARQRIPYTAYNAPVGASTRPTINDYAAECAARSTGDVFG